jgi:hypothetical protein
VPPPWTNLKPDQVELLAATGFLRTAPDPGGGAAEAQQVVADTLKVVASALLGLTVGCAQCHDHKYDPIPQADYYRLRAVFEPALDPSHWRGPTQRRVSLYTDADRARAAAIGEAAAKMQKEYEEKQSRFVEAAFEKTLATYPADQRDKLRLAFRTPSARSTEEQKKLVASNPQNLPAYVVLSDPAGHPVDGTHNWSSGFMPPLYQGTVLRPQDPRILNLDPPPHLRGAPQRQNLDFLAELNRRHLRAHPGEVDLEVRIAGYELAAPMQTAAKEALDVTQEPAHVQRLYGLDQDHTRSYGTRCLIARRLVERGVRFVQLFLGGQPWDTHNAIRRSRFRPKSFSRAGLPRWIAQGSANSTRGFVSMSSR